MNAFNLKFSLIQYNYLVIEEQRYFLFKLLDNSLILTDDRCPHRGGPLHLGNFNKAGCIFCPWHHTMIKEDELIKRSLPLVRVKDVITIVFPYSPSDTFLFFKKGLCNHN